MRCWRIVGTVCRALAGSGGRVAAGQVQRQRLAAELHLSGGQEGKRQRDRAQRQIDEEYPAPRGMFGQEPTQWRAEQRGGERGPDQKGDGAHQVGFFGGAQHDQPANRHHHRATEALQHAGGDELRHGLRGATHHRADNEGRHGGEKHGARPEPLGHPATGQDEHGHRQQIGGDAHMQGDGGPAKAVGHAGQGGCDNRTVQEFHEEGACNQQRQSVRSNRFHAPPGQIVSPGLRSCTRAGNPARHWRRRHFAAASHACIAQRRKEPRAIASKS